MIHIVLAQILLPTMLSILPAQPIEIQAEKPFVPPKNELNGLIITIDAGHGGSSYSPGYAGSARGVNSRAVEGDLNITVAGSLWHMLRAAGADVYMTRWDDQKVTEGNTDRDAELGERVKLAEAARSHLFISLHHNATSRPSADGVVVMTWPTDSNDRDQPLERELDRCLHQEVEKKVHFKEHFPSYISKHPLVSNSDIPSAIVEFGFLTNPDFDAWVTQTGHHRDEARGVYNAIVRMWHEHSAELMAVQAANFADADHDIEKLRKLSGQRWVWPEVVAERRRSLYESLWPYDRPPRTAKEMQWLIDQFRTGLVVDTTFFYLKTSVMKSDTSWQIHVTTNAPRLVKGMQDVFNKLNCDPVRVDLKSLPSDRLGAKRFGITQVPMALVRAGPREAGQADTQLLLGDHVFLLDESDDGGYLLLNGGDGYLGWVRSDAIQRMDEKEFAEWEQAPRAVLRHDVMIDDFRVPGGARLPLLSSDTKNAKLRIPISVRTTHNEANVTVATEDVRLPLETNPGRTAAMNALQYMTVPYLWGGRSHLGLDCSGLTGVAYSTVGLSLPRDAKQQVLVGRLVGTPWHLSALQPGDLIFFSENNGRISHTGISLGGSRFVHASHPEVQVSSLDPADPLYSDHWRERFALARRPLP